MTPADIDQGLWLAYDGECPLCAFAARAVKIRQSAGNLVLVDARTADVHHPLLQQIAAQGLDLNNGIVVRYGSRLYHGIDALNLLATLGTSSDRFNRLAGFVFRSKILSWFLYPILKAVRNILLRLRQIEPIRLNASNETKREPIFKSVFGASWDALPQVMKIHYANRPFTQDRVCVNGSMDIQPARLIRVMAPIARYAGILVPYAGHDVPTAVEFLSNFANDSYTLHRTFQLPKHGTFVFRSQMLKQSNGDMIEFMRCGIGWRTSFLYDGSKVQLLHRGYVLRLFSYNIPLPVAPIIGRGYAEEEAIDDQGFRMMMELRHPLFGRIYRYQGIFHIQDTRLDD